MRLAPAALLGGIACSAAPAVGPGGDPGGAPPLPAAHVPERARVGPEGGRVASLDGEVVVSVLPGALAATATLSIAQERLEAGDPGAPPRAYAIALSSSVAALPLVVSVRATTGVPWGRSSGALALVVRDARREWVPLAASSLDHHGRWVTGLLAGPGVVGLASRGCEACTGEHEACGIDASTTPAEICGVLCAGDIDCPDPLYCFRGVCGVAPCTRDEVGGRCTREGHACAVVAGAPEGVCLPSPRGRPSAAGCAERCEDAAWCRLATRDTPDAVVPGLCVSGPVGCECGRKDCPCARWSAYEEFELLHPEDRVWSYGMRRLGGRTFEAFGQRFARDGIAGWTQNDDSDPHVSRKPGRGETYSGSVRYPDRFLIMEPNVTGSAVLRWTAALSGTYAVDVQIVDAMYAAPNLRGATVEVSVEAGDRPLRSVVLGGRTLGATAELHAEARLEAGESVEIVVGPNGEAKRDAVAIETVVRHVVPGVEPPSARPPPAPLPVGPEIAEVVPTQLVPGATVYLDTRGLGDLGAVPSGAISVEVEPSFGVHAAMRMAVLEAQGGVVTASISARPFGWAGPARLLLRAPSGYAVARELVYGGVANVFSRPAPPGAGLRANVFELVEGTIRLPSAAATCDDPQVLARACPYATVVLPALDVGPQDFGANGVFTGASGNLRRWFALHLEADLVVDRPGPRLLALCSEDGARLEIDGRKIFERDGRRDFYSFCDKMEVPLRARQRLSLWYLRTASRVGLALRWAPEGAMDAIDPIPPEAYRLPGR